MKIVVVVVLVVVVLVLIGRMSKASSATSRRDGGSGYVDGGSGTGWSDGPGHGGVVHGTPR